MIQEKSKPLLLSRGRCNKDNVFFPVSKNLDKPTPLGVGRHKDFLIQIKENKRSQITIFIILGLIIVVGFLIVFFFFNPIEVKIVDENNPQAFIESCTREATEDAIKLLSEGGGDISPKGYVFFKDKEITYLCYNENLYEPCINQRPLLIEHIEKEITNYITPIVSECFLDLESKLKNRYDIESGGMKITTKLQSKNVITTIDKKFKIYRDENIREFNQFKMHLVHPIYDLAKIAMEIVNQEVSYCHFDEHGYMILHQNFDITKFITGDTDIIYGIKEVSTNQEFIFALRSCKLPPGY